MKIRLIANCFLAFAAGLVIIHAARTVDAQDQVLPDALSPWKDWVTWDDTQQAAPTLYRSAEERIAVWPSAFSLAADQTSGEWQVTVLVFAKSWFNLPGSPKTWPLAVKAGENALPVVERDGRPAVQLEAGKYELAGRFEWEQMPPADRRSSGNWSGVPDR